MGMKLSLMFKMLPLFILGALFEIGVFLLDLFGLYDKRADEAEIKFGWIRDAPLGKYHIGTLYSAKGEYDA